MESTLNLSDVGGEDRGARVLNGISSNLVEDPPEVLAECVSPLRRCRRRFPPAAPQAT